jgi:hypothetical protein
MVINQNKVNKAFLSANGDDGIYYDEEDCQIIRTKIRDVYNVELSLSETFTFWRWRSDKYDASWLAVGRSEDIAKWFSDFVEEKWGLADGEDE